MQHTPNRSKLSMKCRFWLPNRPQKMRRLSIRALQVSSHSHHLPSQTLMHNRPSSQCSNLFSRCKTWSATALLNSSWQLGATAQTVRKLEGEPRIEVPKPACEVVVLDAELPSCIPGYSSMDIEGQEAIKRSLSNAATEKRRLAKKCKQEEDVL